MLKMIVRIDYVGFSDICNIAAFFNAFGYGACQPAIQSLCMKRVPKERRGAGSCTSYIGADLGSLLGPVIAGYLAEKIGYPEMWRIMMLPIFIALVFVIIFRSDISSANIDETFGK
jgi:MFS family permease